MERAAQLDAPVCRGRALARRPSCLPHRQRDGVTGASAAQLSISAVGQTQIVDVNRPRVRVRGGLRLQQAMTERGDQR